jgi:predicted N-acetyltransferase YhbS
MSNTFQVPASHAAVRVRPAVPADHPAIRRVVRAAYEQYRIPLGDLLYRRYLADLLDVDRHAREGHLLVAEIQGVVLGSGAFYPDVSTRGLGWPRGWAGGRALAVHPRARRLGVAQALLAACERLAHEHGAPVFAFHTASLMTGAVALYERLGYTRAPHHDQDLAVRFGFDGGPPIHALAYYRVLADSADPFSISSSEHPTQRIAS